MDDNQTDVKTDAGEETSTPEPSTGETQAPEETGSTEEVVETPSEEAPEESEDSSRKGATARIQELNAKAIRERERADSLAQKLEELTGTSQTGTEGPYIPKVEPGAELTPEQYQRDVLKAAESIVDIKVRQNNAVQRINNEANDAIRKYPQLDPDNAQFNKELSDWVTETTMDLVKASPYTASPRKIVERLMKPYQSAVTKEVGKASENIAKQVSQAATRPTSVSSKGNKSDVEKSIGELEKELGFHY